MSKCISGCAALCLVLCTFLFSSYSPVENTSSSTVSFSETATDTVKGGKIVIYEDLKKQKTDTIEYRKSGLGYAYTYRGQNLTFPDLQNMAAGSSEISAMLSKAKGTSTFLSILGYAGGALIGYPIGTWVGGGEPVWEMALIGCGIVAITIPIAIKADKDLLKAVQLYNNNIAPAPRQSSRIELKVGMQSNGLGLALRF